jgi:restriction endonuclease S subunit
MNLKQQLSERDICTKYITPAIKAAGWDIERQVKKNMELMLIPLPPLSEQHRIVAKVQQLMQMVNQLEQHIQQSQAQAQAQKLLQAVLKEAFTSKAKVYEENELVTMQRRNDETIYLHK